MILSKVILTLDFFKINKRLLTYKKSGLYVLACCISLFFFPDNIFAQKKIYYNQNDLKATAYADSILKKMSIEEKIGQMIMIDAYSGTQSNQKHVEWVIKTHHIGGVIFFRGYPTHQVELTNQYQSLSQLPLFIAMDAEWGVNMRLDSIFTLPRQMTLGAIQDKNLLYETGKEIARQCKRLGVNINFAPVVDLNTNPLNPVIHMRAYGEDKKDVSDKAIAFLRGMQDHGVLAVVKHFPGHGDTDKDSHKDLPQIKRDIKSIKQTELYPFQKCFDAGVGGVMVAHLHVPAIDSTPALPTTLSELAVTKLLKQEMKFNGLCFTDAMNMKGVTKVGKAGDNEYRALLAGNDIIVFPQNVGRTISTIKEGVESGELSENDINARVRKILIYKYYLARDGHEAVSTVNIVNDLNTKKLELLNRQLTEASVVLLGNKDNMLPFGSLHDKKIASLSIGGENGNVFERTIDLYTQCSHYQISNNPDAEQIQNISKSLKNYTHIIVNIQSVSYYNVTSFGLIPQIYDMVNALNKSAKLVLVNFGSPYLLKHFQEIPYVLHVGEKAPINMEVAAQALFGAIPIKGKLPVQVGAFKLHDGVESNKILRLKYTIPEELGINSEKLDRIDSIAQTAIRSKAMPGCQIMIVKDGKVFYHKTFGYHNYDRTREVAHDDIYDVASITKVAATILPIMYLYEKKKIALTDSIGQHLNISNESAYGSVSIRELLLHESGFEPWIAFYKNMLDSLKMPSYPYFSNVYSKDYPHKVSDSLFALSSIFDSIWKTIYATPLWERGKFSYSDLNFLFLKRIIDTLIDEVYDQFLYKNYFHPIGMNNTYFNPWQYTHIQRIPETEDDNYFRKRTIKAYVHDPAAALLGGYDGHAGLFSNANDLAKIFQMYLNKGEYAGVRYFRSSTIEEFTKRQATQSRRAYGFDKPETNPSTRFSPTSRNTPPGSFGHTGFTGTCAWADPDNNLIYIFLSNRTYPDSNNKKLIQYNTRAVIQSALYDILKESRLEGK